MADHRAIVIGTGFGGAVSACRLAQAGFAVRVFERGRRYDQEEPAFPRGPKDNWLWERNRGLFEVWPVTQMRVLQAAGYGGGSLIYANVHLRPPPEVFTRGWPEGYSRDALDPYYDLVAYMLDIQPITSSPRGLPPKTRRMTEALIALGRNGQTFYPPLALDFSAGEDPHPNKFGVTQGPCIHCGECVIGCVQRAKNTLDMNYLAIAERLGAEMNTECEVLSIEQVQRAGAPLYRVRYRDHRRGGDELSAEAEHVLVCAGALNSTALLLRSREALPRLSARLGMGYSGNGDMLAGGFETAEPFEPSKGPTITTGVVYAGKGEDREGWFLIEDGGFPRHLWPIFELASPHHDWWRLRPRAGEPGRIRVAPPITPDIDAAFRRAAEQMGAAEGEVPPPAMQHTAAFLAMGRDLAEGRLKMHPGGKLSLEWDVPSNLLLYSLEERIVRDIMAGLHGTFALSPIWRFAHLPISVHNLGGCVMGKSEADGVTSEIGEVFNYPNLFVLDGAILPAATGVNPSHTIAAVAERNIERIIRRITGLSGWVPPERAHATPYPDPLSRVVIPRDGTLPPAYLGLGLLFHEKMKGSWRSVAGGTGGPVDMRLQIAIAYLARFLSDPEHSAKATGTISVEGLTKGKADVQEGTWNLFAPRGSGPELEMRYLLRFYGEDGRSYVLRGVKVFRPSPGLDLWRENTTLEFEIHEGTGEHLRLVGEGVARISLLEVLRLLLSLRVPGPDTLLDKARATFGFLKFYLRTLARMWPARAEEPLGR